MEERLVLKNGTAERTAKLILAEGAAGWREVVACVEIGIAEEFERVTVKCVGSGFSDHADLACAAGAELRGIVAGVDAKFRNGFEAGLQPESAGVHQVQAPRRDALAARAAGIASRRRFICKTRRRIRPAWTTSAGEPHRRPRT